MAEANGMAAVMDTGDDTPSAIDSEARSRPLAERIAAAKRLFRNDLSADQTEHLKEVLTALEAKGDVEGSALVRRLINHQGSERLFLEGLEDEEDDDDEDTQVSTEEAEVALVAPKEQDPLQTLKAQIKAFRALSNNSLPDRQTMFQATGKDLNDLFFFHKAQPGETEKLADGQGRGDFVTDREHRIVARMQQRIHELENLPVSLPADLRQQALIELRALRLAPLQKKMRREVVQAVQPNSTATTAMRIRGLVRERMLPLRNARRTEQYEKQLRLEQERRKVAARQAFLQEIVDHGFNFKQFHADVKRDITKINRSLSKRWEAAGKKQDEKEQERLRLLRAQDEAGYRALLDKEKDKRLMLILDKTDEYMTSMKATIQQYQAEEAAKEQPKDDAVEGSSGAPNVRAVVQIAAVEQGESGAGDTYASTHRVQERVTEQPKSLQFGSLKPYQLVGLEWLVSLYNNRLNGILADEMGLGKTIQTIALLSYVAEKKDCYGPFLVIVPLATVSNWELEFSRWAPHFNVISYHGGKAKRRMLADVVRSGQFNVVLTTYEYVTRDKAALSRTSWKLMIIDEGHRMKNSHCKLTQVITEYYDAPRRLLLTGTPLQNKLPELWALLNFLLPRIFNSCRNFEEWFSAPFAGTSEKLELSEEEQLLIIQRLHKVLRPFLLRRLKSDVESQLPDKVEKVLKCNMSALQQVLYHHMQNYNVLLTDGADEKSKGTGGGSRALQNTIIQLRNICNHPFIFRDVEEGLARFQGVPQVDDIDLMRVCGKFELLDRVLPKLYATGHRVLVFSTMTNLLTVLGDYLDSKGYRFMRMDGATKAEERQAMLKDFNAPDSPYFIFLLSTRAGGLGLNLQTADTVIIYDSDWNPHQDLQAQDRAHRIGQTKEVRVLRLCTVNSIEEKILAIAKYKLDVDAKVIQAGLFKGKHSKENESKKLLEQLLGDEDGEVEPEENDVSEEALNESLARSDEEFQIFQEMDKQRERDDAATWMRGRRKARLMETSELPPWCHQKESDVAARVEKARAGFDAEEAVGTKRQRNQVDYSETLTDRQFMDAIEAGEDLDAAVEKKKQKKRKPKQANGASGRKKRSRAENGDGDGDDDIAALFNAVDEISLCATMMNLPGPDEFAEYHSQIKYTIDMAEIKSRYEQGKYEDVAELEEDIVLLASNTQEFYDSESEEFEQAQELLETVERLKEAREA